MKDCGLFPYMLILLVLPLMYSREHRPGLWVWSKWFAKWGTSFHVLLKKYMMNFTQRLQKHCFSSRSQFKIMGSNCIVGRLLDKVCTVWQSIKWVSTDRLWAELRHCKPVKWSVDLQTQIRGKHQVSRNNWGWSIKGTDLLSE